MAQRPNIAMLIVRAKFTGILSDSGYVHTGTVSYRYRTGLIFGTEKLTVHTGPVRYRTSFGSCSHGYDIVPVHDIARQN